MLTGAEFRDRLTLELGSILDADPNAGAVSRPVILPSRSLVVIEPLSDPDILRVLRRSPEPRGSGLRTTVTIAGFPAASCAATSATVEPIDSQAGTRLASQWKSMVFATAARHVQTLARRQSAIGAPDSECSRGTDSNLCFRDALAPPTARPWCDAA